MVTKRTIQRRIKKGMTREQAETMPNMRLSGITKNDLLELSTLGLSRRGAASIFGVSQTLVNNKIKEFGIDWVGKPIHNKKGQKNPNAIRNKCILLGVSKSNVYRIKRTYNLTSDQALEIAYTRKLKKIMGFYHD